MSIESGVVAAAKAAAAEAAPSVATIAPLEALLGAVIDVLSGEGGAAVRAGLRLRGYALVGSAALIGSSPDRNLGDLDVVLLSDGSSTEGGYDGGVALWQVYEALRSAAPSDGYDVHFVSANVPIVKVSRADASLDLLWLSGVLLPPASVESVVPVGEIDTDAHTRMVIEPGGSSGSRLPSVPPATTLAEEAGDELEPPAYFPPPALVRYEAEDERVVLPAVGCSGAADAVRLSRILGRTIRGGSPSFTVDTILRLRGWAKARHLYGSKYGYPGGSAWTVSGAGRNRPAPPADAMGVLYVLRLGQCHH